MLPFWFIFSILFSYAEPYKILVYSSAFGYSHMNFLGSIADTLTKAGHDVTVLQPVINWKLNTTAVNIAKVIQVEIDEATRKAAEPFDSPDLWTKIWTVNTKNPIGVVMHAATAAYGFECAMKNVLNNKKVMEQLRKEKFDVGIAEMFDYGGFPVFYELGITKILGSHSTVLTDRTASAIGLPILPSFVPPMQSSAGDDGSFLTRLSNVIFTAASWYFEKVLEDSAQKYMDENHSGKPKIQEIISNMSFIFTNSEPLLDFPRPKLYKVIDIGGIGLKPTKKLDERWLKILSERKKNVLISFGSVAPSFQMPQEFKDNILKVIQEFPDVTFIWKYEHPEDGTGSNVKNVHMVKWTPQSDLLASGHLDLFITHGGAGSILESASAGIPLVVIPLFGDQFRNALMAERFGFAMILDKADIPSFKLKKIVTDALTNNSIKSAAKRSKEMLAARPFSPQEQLLKYVDLAVKFESLPNLMPTGRNFTVVQYHNLDIYVLFVTTIIFSIVSFIWVIKKCCCGSKSVKKMKTH